MTGAAENKSTPDEASTLDAMAKKDWRSTSQEDRNDPRVTVTMTREQRGRLDDLEEWLADEVAESGAHPGGQAPRGASGTVAFLIDQAWARESARRRR